MQFNSVLGQQDLKIHLVDLVQQNRLSHAMLFLGKEGSGHLALAIAFAQYLTCTSVRNRAAVPAPGLFASEEPVTSPAPAMDSCGHCASCIKSQQLIHPDIHFSFPVIPKKAGTPPLSDDYIAEWRKFVAASPYGNVFDWLQFLGAENKQGNITAEECNQINHKLSLKAFESSYKILIMWMPEFLGNSGNKLLKLIEEPPPDTLFIFVAQDENAILPTILSRTQLVKVPSLPAGEIEKVLLTTGDVTPQTASSIAGLCEGNYREALLLLHHSQHDWEQLIRVWLNAIVKNNPGAQVKWIDEIGQLGREKQKQFLRHFIHLLHQAIRLRFINDEQGEPRTALIPDQERDFGLRLNKMCPLEGQEAIVNELNDAIFYIERNAHPKMLFHALSIRLYHIIKDNSLLLIN